VSEPRRTDQEGVEPTRRALAPAARGPIAPQRGTAAIFGPPEGHLGLGQWRLVRGGDIPAAMLAPFPSRGEGHTIQGRWQTGSGLMPRWRALRLALPAPRVFELVAYQEGL
jgi:hypothetical protein